MVMLTDKVVELGLTPEETETLKSIAGIHESSTVDHVYRGFEGIFIIIDKAYYLWLNDKEKLEAAKGLGRITPKRNTQDTVYVSDVLRVNNSNPDYRRYTGPQKRTGGYGIVIQRK